MDIFEFLKKFLLKYDYNINIKLLLQDTGETKKNFDDINTSLLSELYNISKNNKEKENLDNENENDVDGSNAEKILNDLNEN